jgi:hypothetical protein
MFYLNAGGVVVQLCDSHRKSWYRQMSDSINAQCEGFDKNILEQTPDVIISDYNSLDEIDKQEAVSQSYSIREGIFVDATKGIAYRYNSSKQLEYWHDMSHEFSIPFLLQLLFLSRDCSFVHSAGITYNGKAYIFPAFGGVGKTLLISELMKHEGVKLLGDDLTIIDANGFARSYARPLCLYEHHRDAFSDTFKKLKIRYFGPTIFWKILRRLYMFFKYKLNISIPHLGPYMGINSDYVLVSPDKIYGVNKIEKGKVLIGKIIVLRRKAEAVSVQVNPFELDELIRFSSNVTIHEWKPFIPGLIAAGALLGCEFPDYINNTRININSAFEKCSDISVLDIPEIINLEDYFGTVKKIIGIQ